MSLAAVGVAAGVTSVNKQWTTDTLNSFGKGDQRACPANTSTNKQISWTQNNPPGKKFEEGHDRTIRLGISQERTGSSLAHFCLTRLLQRLSMQNSHVVHINVSPSSAWTG